MRDLLFRPMFGIADLLASSTAGALMLSGHWLASIPVAIAGGLVAHFGRKRMLARVSLDDCHLRVPMEIE